MEIVTVVAGLISSLCTPDCVKAVMFKKCKHIACPTKELASLGKLKAILVAEVADIRTRLLIEEMEPGKSSTNRLKKWLNDVDRVLDETNDLEREVTIPKSRLNHALPSCFSCSNFGQRISKLIEEVTALSEEGGKLSNEPLTFLVPGMGMELQTRELMGQTTALKTLEMIWECLVDDENRMIGVYGMGGVGKTTIMHGIYNQLLEQHHLFDKLIWVTVSKDANVFKLQDDIANQINLGLSPEQDEYRRSSMLLGALRKRGRIMFILDDMWEKFSLEEIGIPICTKDNGCKLVLTTRSLEVCQSMRCKKEIKVEILPEDEAWELFVKEVDTKLDRKVEVVAKDVAKECAGLPLAIIAIAGAMRGKEDIEEWRTALTDLQESTNWALNMEEQVIEHLKFSYNRLGDDILKNCFLYCALYPEDFEIHSEELIDHWLMNGLITGRSIRQELDRGKFILNKLKRCLMLEYGIGETGGWEYVKMHDLMRDMALHITKDDPQFMVKAREKLKKVQDDKEWGEKHEKVSFMESDITEILISPNCRGLVTLLLNRTPLKRISDDFFVQMQGLTVLNLSNTEIEDLPGSISNLVNLQVLDLSWCKLLKRVPSVRKLRSLRVLRLVETAIEELPHGMETVVTLKRLDLTRTKLREIPAFLVSSNFPLLQELHAHPLHLPISFADEMPSVTHLENLSIGFADLSDLTRYVRLESFKHLDYFFFDVKHGLDMSEFHPTMRRSVTVCNDSGLIPENVLRIPHNTEYLGVMEFHELTRLSGLACLKDARELKKCFVRECSEMECILFSEEDNLLKHLENIGIKGCPKLTTLHKGVPTRDTLSCLKTVHISKCHNLKYLLLFTLFNQLQNLVEVYIDCCELEQLILASDKEMDEANHTNSTSSIKKLKLLKLPKLKTLFSKRMSQYFQNLELVDVMYCNGMEELIAEEGTRQGTSSSNNNAVTFPRLKKLNLVNLPELKSICRGGMICDSLQSVRVSSCPELKKLPLFTGEDQLPPPALKEINGSIEWWNSLEWRDGSFAKNLFRPMFQVHW